MSIQPGYPKKEYKSKLFQFLDLLAALHLEKPVFFIDLAQVIEFDLPPSLAELRDVDEGHAASVGFAAKWHCDSIPDSPSKKIKKPRWP